MNSNKLLFVLLLFPLLFNAQEISPLETQDHKAQSKWVDSIMDGMTLDQKIGQLFMVQAYSNKDIKHRKFIEQLIVNHEIGGLIFMQGTPGKQALLTNKYQSISKIPLLIGFDGEWGLDMRLKNTFRYPWNMTLGAIQDNALIEQMGRNIGEHCKRLGIHMNFAPVADININPENPIIGNRSFGEHRDNVANKSLAYTTGLQSVNVLASGKHFPGHGDTADDSHSKLPVLPFSKKRLENIELFPYKKLIEGNLTSIMVAHLGVKSLEPNPSLPTSLSYNVITNLLKRSMGFKGLVLTDALNMKGASNFAKPGDIDLAAIMAGNDILLIPEDVPAAVIKIKNAVSQRVLTVGRIEESVRKILMAKYWAGLNKFEFVDIENLSSDLNRQKDELLHRELVDASITLAKNEGAILPITNIEKTSVAFVKLGDADHVPFLQMLKNYEDVKMVKADKLDELITKLESFDRVIIGFHKSNQNPWKDYKFKENELVKLQEIARIKKVILVNFASPYSLLQVKTFKNIEAVVVAYQNSSVAQEITAQMLYGGRYFKGRLPVSVSYNFKVGHGMDTRLIDRLNYDIPESVAMDSKQLEKIDSVASLVVREKMAPGLQVLVARKGTVIYNKSFGYHTDRQKVKVKNNHKYDVASLTKILASLPLIMQLEEKDSLQLDSELGELLPSLKGSNKDTLTVKEVLSHYGRLKAWIPFYTTTLDSVTGDLVKDYYSKQQTETHPIKIAEAMFLRRDFKDSIFTAIANAEQRERIGYKYSDLPFYLMKAYIEELYGKNLHLLTQEKLYKILGATNTAYLPLTKFPEEEIVPTERDDYWRHQLLRGYVHDMGAAMQNGIGGHAGLFSNANDVAKIMQMYLQNGSYGEYQFFSAETMSKFNKRYYADKKNRKGIGFDKPQLKESEKATCGCVSDLSFGHSGFTGTYAWADPESEIVYVFLSNRVYPTMENSGLVRENIRTEIQHIIQEAILD